RSARMPPASPTATPPRKMWRWQSPGAVNILQASGTAITSTKAAKVTFSPKAIG
ncbi:unnamed protein product, partial [Symbiodinium sp. CCMP2456]